MNFRDMQNAFSVLMSSFLERLHTQFLTGFHKSLHTARKRGRLDAYCFLDKPEVDFGSFTIAVATFFHRLS